VITDGTYAPLDKRRWPLTWLLSPWVIGALLAIGWVPIYALRPLSQIFTYLNSEDVAEGFGMAWGMGVMLPSTFLAGMLTVIQIFRWLLNLVSPSKSS